MKNLKKILIALAVLAVLVSSVAIIVGASDVEYTGNVSDLQAKFNEIDPTASTAKQAEKLVEVYIYLSTAPVDPATEGYAELATKINGKSVELGNAYYAEIAKAADVSAKLVALETLYAHLVACPPDATYAPEATELLAKTEAANEEIATLCCNNIMDSADVKASRTLLITLYGHLAAHPVSSETAAKVDEAFYATAASLYDAYMAMPKTHVDADEDGKCDSANCPATTETFNTAAASYEYLNRHNEIGLCYYLIYATGMNTSGHASVTNLLKAKADMEAETAAKQAALDSQASFDDYDLTGYHVFKDYELSSPDANQSLFSGYNQTAQGYTTHQTDIYGNRYQAMVYGADGTHNYIAPSHGTNFTSGLVIEFDIKLSDDFTFIQYQAHHGSVGIYNVFRITCNARDGHIQLYNEPSRTNVSGVKKVTMQDAIVPEVWSRLTMTYDNETRLGKLYINYEYVMDLEYSAEWQYQYTRIGTNFTNQLVCLDNFSIFQGSEYRIYDKFEKLDSVEKFDFYVNYMLDPNNASLSRNSAYNKAKNLYLEIEQTFPDNENLAKFASCDYESEIKRPAMAQNIIILTGMVDELVGMTVTSKTVADINKAIAAIDEFVKTNSELINKGDTSEGGYQDQMTKVQLVRENLIKIENISAFASALTKFNRAVGYDALLKHMLTAKAIYEAAEYDIEENVNFVKDDPIVATFELLINGEEITPEDEGYITIFEYYANINTEVIERQLYENSKRIVNCIDIITSMEGYEATPEFWGANAEEISGYADIIRAIIVEGIYATDYEGIDEAIATFNTLNVYFYEYIQQQHIAFLRDELAKYIATESYIDRMGICNTIKAYLDNNDIACFNQDTLANAVYVVVADEIEALRQCIIEYEVYVAEIAAMAPDYENILAQNTYYFIGIVQQMTTCISYVDIKPLFEKAESYYYGINVDTEEALEAAEIYAIYRDLIAYYEATAEIFIGYVTSLNAANDPSLSLVEKEDVIYVALSNAMAYASLVDEGVEGVAAAMAKYETALANYNAETEIVNSELAGATQITCATRSGYISATVLAIISKLFGN